MESTPYSIDPRLVFPRSFNAFIGLKRRKKEKKKITIHNKVQL